MVSSLLSIPLPGQALGDGSSSQPARAMALRRFVAGEENQLAAAAVGSLLQQVDSPYNPLVLYGGGGTGKSHLAHGLARHWKRTHPQARVVYIQATDLSRRLGDEQQERENLSSDRYADAALLVVEDVQQIGSKPHVQRFLARAIDAVLRGGGRAIITLREHPSRSKTLVATLRSRLAAGLVVGLSKPSTESRAAILRELAERRGLVLPSETLDKLAERIEGTAPRLFSALVRMEVAARAEGAAVDARHADQLLAERSAESGLTLASIAKATARYYDVTLADMKSKSRRKAIVAARGMAVYLARERTGASLVSIGRFFGGRDHTTALHAYRSTRKRIAETSEAAQALAEVEALLGEG